MDSQSSHFFRFQVSAFAGAPRFTPSLSTPQCSLSCLIILALSLFYTPIRYLYVDIEVPCDPLFEIIIIALSPLHRFHKKGMYMPLNAYNA